MAFQKFTYLFGAELVSVCHFPYQIPGPVFYKFSDEKQRKKYSYSELSLACKLIEACSIALLSKPDLLSPLQNITWHGGQTEKSVS